MNTVEVSIIIVLLLVLAFMLKSNGCESFWSSKRDPDRVLASYVTRSKSSIERVPFLPSNKIILKGHSSEYWDCYEMNKALGSSSNEILSKCKQFV